MTTDNKSKNDTLSFKCDNEFANKIRALAKLEGVSLGECLRGCVELGAGRWVKKRKEGIPDEK